MKHVYRQTINPLSGRLVDAEPTDIVYWVVKPVYKWMQHLGFIETLCWIMLKDVGLMSLNQLKIFLQHCWFNRLCLNRPSALNILPIIKHVIPEILAFL